MVTEMRTPRMKLRDRGIGWQQGLLDVIMLQRNTIVILQYIISQRSYGACSDCNLSCVVYAFQRQTCSDRIKVYMPNYMGSHRIEL